MEFRRLPYNVYSGYKNVCSPDNTDAEVRTHHASVAPLHWLPIRQRTLFKVLVLTCCAVNATAHSYLVQRLHHRNVSRTLRSGSSTYLLSVPPSRTVTHGDRCFSVASPTLWNNLPVSLRTAKCLTQFRSQLKTHIFKVAFTYFI